MQTVKKIKEWVIFAAICSLERWFFCFGLVFLVLGCICRSGIIKYAQWHCLTYFNNFIWTSKVFLHDLCFKLQGWISEVCHISFLFQSCPVCVWRGFLVLHLDFLWCPRQDRPCVCRAVLEGVKPLPRSQLPLLPSAAQGDGSGSYGQFTTGCFCRCAGRGVRVLPCSSREFLSWETVFHELLQCESIPQAAVLHRLLQRGSLFPGVSPLGCSASLCKSPVSFD